MTKTTTQYPQSLTTIFLDQPPSCLQFCPQDPDYFVVGTYLLSETRNEDGNVQQNKTGSLQLWKLDPGSSNLKHIQIVSLPYAVFDLHFHPRDPTLLGIASSSASVSFFRVSGISGGQDGPVIQHVRTIDVHEDPSIPALFLAWAPENFLHANMDGFAVTFSDGRTSIFGTKHGLTEGEFEEDSFQAREMIEVWFVALGTFREADPESRKPIPFLFTGDDFGSLRTRRFVPSEEAGTADDLEASLPTVLLDHDDRARHHTAGVTSILPLPLPLLNGAPLLLTGSYDEHLRVYHATQRGVVLAETELDGGVWRLQLLRTSTPSEGHWSFVVLASCMHAGTRVVRITWRRQSSEAGEEGEWDIEVLAKFTEHESMNYASDVWRGEGGEDKTSLLCVTSSFYDRRVCVWRAEMQDFP